MWITGDEETLLQCCCCKSLLRDPVLLQCLHNICSHCSEKVRCAKEGGTALVCPACSVETDFAMEKENLFVAGQISELEKLRNASRCGVCFQERKTEETADDWCSQCQMSLCARCSSGHYLHNRNHCLTAIAEVRSIKDLLEMSPHKCRRHGKTYDLMCWTCKIPACTSCAEECYQEKHQIEILNTRRTWDHFERIKEKIWQIQTVLSSQRDTLQRCKNVISELDNAQVKHLIELQNTKRAAVESLDRAYKVAEAALQLHYSKLREKALELRHSVELMDVRVSQASEYSRYLAASDDRTGLLHQETVLLSGLQSLVKELSEMKAPQDVTQFVAIVGAMPENLDDHTSAWIGMPRLLTDDLFCSDELMARLEMDLNKSVHLSTVKNQLLPVGVIQRPSLQDQKRDLLVPLPPGDVANDFLDLGAVSSAFQSPVICCDVAVSSGGCSLLLAAVGLGLKEFDLSGSELSSWKPAENTVYGGTELVWTVDALQDGRVAAGLLYSRCVVVLRRSQSAWQKGDAWLEDMRVTELQIPPRRLSVCADVVAVAEARLNEKMLWLPGRSLVLASLSSGRVLSRQQRTYGIGSVMVTAGAVVTASCKGLKLGGGRAAWVVDACSHDGQFMWRQELDEVWDMCAAPSGRVLYITLCESSRVVAIRAEDGAPIKDILISNVKRPARLSVNARVQGTLGAVLSSDWTTVTVYRAKLRGSTS